MADPRRDRVAVLYRGDRSSHESSGIGEPRLAPVGAALAEAGLVPEAVVYDDDWAADVRDRLLAVRGVLVWVDPISGSQDRARLDAVLREVAAAGGLGLRAPRCDPDDGHQGGAEPNSRPRLVRRHTPVRRPRPDVGLSTPVVVQGARERDETVEQMPLAEFLARLGTCFDERDGHGRLIDQPFQARIDEGLIRCYLVCNEVVGFYRQYPASSHSPRRVPAQAIPKIAAAVRRALPPADETAHPASWSPAGC